MVNSQTPLSGKKLSLSTHPRRPLSLRKRTLRPARRRRFSAFFQALRVRGQRIVAPALHILAGGLLGSIALPFGLYPCGIALVCADSQYALFSCVGSAIASLFLPAFSGVCFGANLLVAFLRAYRTNKRFDEPIRERVIVAAAVGLLCAILGACFSGGDAVLLIRCAAGAGYLPLLCACFCRLRGNARLSAEFSVGDGVLYGGAALFTLAAARLSDALLSSTASSVSYYPALTVAVLFTLAALRGGTLHGLSVGLLCGVCTGSLPFAAALGVGGFVGGLCTSRRKRVVLPLFFLSFCAVVLFLFPLGAYDASIAVLVGALLYVPITEIFGLLTPHAPRASVTSAANSPRPAPAQGINDAQQNDRSLSKVFSLARSTERSAHALAPSFPRSLDHSTRQLSSALSSVSELLFNTSDKLRYPTAEEVERSTRAACASMCSACEQNCKELLTSSLDRATEERIVSRLCGGGVALDDLPSDFRNRCACTRLDRLIDRLNEEYAVLSERHFRENNLEILASEYSAMARLLKHTAGKAQADRTPDPTLTAKLTEALCAVGVRFSSACVYGLRGKILDVYGVAIEGFPCTAAEMAAYLGEKCGLPLTEPEFIGVGKKATMRLRQARKLHVEYARAVGAKGENAVSGDSVSFFESDDDRFYALISDGMGSGRSAALTSRLTALYVEKLLTCGTHKAVTLELLNDLLLSKSDESFATVDLLEIDLLSGEACFIKAGAAPAYILRAAKLYKIASCTPPAGIVRSFNAESTKFSLETGDTAVMLSDGIVQSCDELPWLCDMLTAEASTDPAKLANRILAKAKKMNVREDDMTAVVLRIG